jgi:hypothetical protein
MLSHFVYLALSLYYIPQLRFSYVYFFKSILRAFFCLSLLCNMICEYAVHICAVVLFLCLILDSIEGISISFEAHLAR